MYVGDVLIDDTQPRTVALAEGDAPTVLTLRATAQDHATAETCTVRIVRAQPKPPLTVSSVTAGRCVAGKAALTMQTTNASTVPVALTVTTPYGVKQVATLAPGKTTSAVFTTRVAAIAAGSVSVVTTGTVDGAPASVTTPAAYAAIACG